MPADSRQQLVALLVGGGSALLFLTLVVLVWRTNGPVGLDRLADRLIRATGEGRRRLWWTATRLGSPSWVALSSATLVSVALIWRDRVGALLAVLGPAVTGLLTEFVAKPLVNCPASWGGRMFPSGHAGGLAAVAVVALVLVHRRWGRGATAVLAPLAAVAVFASSVGVVRLGLHYPTDAVGGVALAATVVLSLTVGLEVLAAGPASGSLSPRRAPLENEEHVDKDTGRWLDGAGGALIGGHQLPTLHGRSRGSTR